MNRRYYRARFAGQRILVALSLKNGQLTYPLDAKIATPQARLTVICSRPGTRALAVRRMLRRAKTNNKEKR